MKLGYARVSTDERLPWRTSDNGARMDLVLMGDPDCHAYIVKYVAVRANVYGNAYCWDLTMPRMSGSRFSGWDRTMAGAKRQVASTIKREWR